MFLGFFLVIFQRGNPPNRLSAYYVVLHQTCDRKGVKKGSVLGFLHSWAFTSTFPSATDTVDCSHSPPCPSAAVPQTAFVRYGSGLACEAAWRGTSSYAARTDAATVGDSTRRPWTIRSELGFWAKTPKSNNNSKAQALVFIKVRQSVSCCDDSTNPRRACKEKFLPQT